MTNIYTVEIDGVQYDIEGDRPPTEAEARSAVLAYAPTATNADVVSDLPGGGWDQAAAEAEPRWYSPQKRNAAARFLEPIGAAVKGAASVPGLIGTVGKAYGKFMGGRVGEAAADVAPLAEAALEPQFALGRRAREELRRGDYGEGVKHSVEAFIPILGPAVSDIRDAIAEGNLAGAAGQLAVLATTLPTRGGLARGVQGPVQQSDTLISRLLQRQAAAREFSAMRPLKRNARKAEDIALDAAQGIAGTDEGGLGVGTRRQLAARAKARAELAGQQIKGLQSSALGVGDLQADIIVPLRAEGESLVSQTPVARRSAYATHGEAFHKQADFMEALASDFGGDTPLGVLLTQREALNRRFASSHDKLPGDFTPAEAEAGKATSMKISDMVHRDVPATAVVDRKYEVARNAFENFEQARISQLTNQGREGLKALLSGRLGGIALGGAVGAQAGGLPWGVAGALIGTLIGESAVWQTFRATTYAKLAKALNRGDLRAASDILNRAVTTYAVEHGISERERNRAAQRALQSQAEGVVAP